MDDKEKIREFADMVDAVERLEKPLQEENERLHQQIKEQREHYHKIIRIIVIGFSVVLSLFIGLAYLSPDTSVQMQDSEAEQQFQISGTDAANSANAVMNGFVNGKTSPST